MSHIERHRMIRHAIRYLPVLFLLGILVACSDDETPTASPASLAEEVATDTATPEPTTTHTPQPSDTPTAGMTPEPSDTPTPAWTPTLTPIPTHTATPEPEPTEEQAGYFRDEATGFALSYPEDWVIIEAGDGTVSFEEENFGLSLFASRSPIEEDLDFDEVLDYFGGLVYGEDNYTVFQRDEILLGDAYPAERAILAASGAQIIDFSAQLIVSSEAGRPMMMLATGPMFLFATAYPDLDLTEVYDSIELFDAGLSLHGLDIDDTLLLLSGEPNIEALDPALQTGSSGDYVGLLFSGLVRLSTAIGVEPDLAESWTVSPDGTVYTFTLRPEAAFANGRPLTAHDVKYSWERATDPDTGSQTAGTYLGDILGVAEKLAGEAETISGVVVVDDHTLVVTLDGPKPYFLAKLSYPVSYVVAREDVATDPEGWAFYPNASGPYQVQEYSPGETMILARNESYYAPAEISHVLMRFNLFGNPLSLYEAGEIDFVGLGPDDIVRIQQPDDPQHEQLLSGTELCTTFVHLNNTRPPLDDIDVRRALALALDNQGLVDNLYDGILPAANTLLPPGMPGYSLAGIEPGHDPAAAREALAASAYAGELPPIIIGTGGQGDAEDPVSLAIGQMWQDELGLDFSVAYYDQLNYTAAARELDAHVIIWGWCADYPDPENFLDLLFHSNSDFNLAEYSNPEVDALLEEARTVLDPTDRLALYHEIELMLLEDGALIPLNYGAQYFLVSPRIQGFVVTPMDVAQMHRLTITPEEE